MIKKADLNKIKWLIVSGGRDYKFSDLDRNILSNIFNKHNFNGIITGGSTGADECAEKWARNLGIPLLIFPADWDTYGKAAGPIRNEIMSEVANSVLFFPGGKGTSNMRKHATNNFLTIYDAEDEKKKFRITISS
jgi:hypothetical protein